MIRRALLRNTLGRMAPRATTTFSTGSNSTQTFDYDKKNDGKSTNIVWSEGLITQEERIKLTGKKGCTLWITGLSGSGKSTVACALEHEILKATSSHPYRLDGDNVRFGLNKDLGFTEQDREENIRRIGEVAKLFADSGSIAITAFISPYQRDREAVRKLHEEAGIPFFEVHTHVPLDVAEGRDPKGLYKKARAGEIKGFTGIDDPYEAPESPEIVLPTHEFSVDQSVAKMMEFLNENGLLQPKK